MALGVLSDITGIKASQTFTPSMIPSLSGKVYIVTGGHGGIGLATTKFLALAGAKVYIASRTESKVTQAMQELYEQHPETKGHLEYLKLDLASLKATKAAAEEFLQRENQLHGLINNAGVMAVGYEMTEDGIETQFQVNHLAHWLFTMKLEPLMDKTGKESGHPSRVVNLSSFAHNFISFFPKKPQFDSIESVNRYYEHSGYIRYSQAKLSAILFSREFNKKFSTDHVKSLSVHPGFVKSNLYGSSKMMKPMLATFIPIDEGAYSTLYAATSPEIEEKNLWGAYLVPHAKVKNTTAYGNDEKLASDLWNLCTTIVNEKVGGI